MSIYYRKIFSAKIVKIFAEGERFGERGLLEAVGLPSLGQIIICLYALPSLNRKICFALPVVIRNS
ncbi:hypothetical protein HMPREF0156_00630 [Bacteroidetes oral taxon 274 str. F0058]|nr:hypothetical protein HMPREF0156_00630 [Bacteroidetes oral taxon 274 str. F0058]